MISKKALGWCGAFAAVLGAGLALAPSCALLMPGDSYTGPLPVVTEPQCTLTDMLESDVTFLAGTIGERNLANPPSLRHAADYIAAELSRAGYLVRWQTYTATTPNGDQHQVSNLDGIL